jgi:hypothetical protein
MVKPGGLNLGGGRAPSTLYLYAISWTPATALPDGSFMFLNVSSHSSAFAVEHATDASCGSVFAAVSEG